jgi:hypothetical protein
MTTTANYTQVPNGPLEESMHTSDVAMAIMDDFFSTKSKLKCFGFPIKEAAKIIHVALAIYKTCKKNGTSFSMDALIEGYIEEAGPRPTCTDNCHDWEESHDIIRHLMGTMQLAPTCDVMTPTRRFLLQYDRMPTREELATFVAR